MRKSQHSAVNNNVAAAAAGHSRHSDLYQLMQMLVEANSISQQLNRHTVGHSLMLLSLKIIEFLLNLFSTCFESSSLCSVRLNAYRSKLTFGFCLCIKRIGVFVCFLALVVDTFLKALFL